jgi:hypothetical protein
LESCRQTFVRPERGRPAKYHHADCGREAARLAAARRTVENDDMRRELVVLRSEVSRLRAVAVPERLIPALSAYLEDRGVEWRDLDAPVSVAVECLLAEALGTVTYEEAAFAPPP